MNYLLPSIRYLVPVVALFLWAQVAVGQNGCTTGWSTQAGIAPDGNVALPASLGVGVVPFVNVDIFLDANCNKRFNISVTPFETDCNIIEYYNLSGQLVGVEDQDEPGSSTFIFNESDLDGTIGPGGYPSGVADNPTSCDLVGSVMGATPSDGVRGNFPLTNDDYRNEGYSPDYRCNYEPDGCFNGAEVGQYYFFRSMQDLNTADPAGQNNAGVNDGYHYFDGLVRNTGTTYRAVFIRSVTDGSGPIIKGSINTLCTQGMQFDNNPTSLQGDPRSANNTTHTTIGFITDNDRTAGTGMDMDYENGVPVIPGDDDQVRALICTEDDDPCTGGPERDYGFTDPQSIAFMGAFGAGFIDADANGNGLGDKDGLDYTNPAASVFDIFNNGNEVQNVAPDGCGGAVTVTNSDQRDYFERGYIYGLNSIFPIDDNSATSAYEVPAGYTGQDQVFVDSDADNIFEFGEGGDGRFRKCYTIDRTWIATDRFGNSSSCIQVIDVIDDYEGNACGIATDGITTPVAMQMSTIQATGSPYFSSTTAGGVVIGVTPQLTTVLSCNSGVENIYENTLINGSRIPTLYKYDNPLNFPANIVAPNYVSGGATASQGATSTAADTDPALPALPREHYNFPVFTYDENPNVYSCTQVNTLDGFLPVAADSCGLRPLQEIETLFDRGGDGDFGDLGTNIFISGSVACPFWDDNYDLYFNNWAMDGTGTRDQAANSNGYMRNDDSPSTIPPTDCRFYEYDMLKRWVMEDNCGFRSIAQRIYHISDVEAPDVFTTNMTIVTATGNTTIAYTPTFVSSSSTTGTNIKTYDLGTNITLPNNTCTPTLFFSTDFQDNCALDQYVGFTYDVEQFNSTLGIYVPSSTGNPYNAVSGIVLTPGSLNRVTLRYTDPCGNFTNLRVIVQTLNDSNLICNPTFAKELTVGGTVNISFLELAGYSNIVQALSDVCVLPSCVQLRINGAPIATGNTTASGEYQVISGPSGPNISNLGLNDPFLVFGCDDVGMTYPVTVELYAVSGCTPLSGTSNYQADAGANFSLIGSCMSQVTINASSIAAVNATPVVVPATSATASDGSIALTISSAITEPFNVMWNGTSAGSAVNVGSSYSITGLLPGTYNVTVQGVISCATWTQSITIGTNTPLELKFLCPSPVVEGNVINVQIAATSNFTNLNSIDFGITLNSPAGASIIDLQQANGFGSTTGGFNIGSHYFIEPIAERQADVVWSSTGMENLVDCQAFITVLVNVPPGSSPGTLSITLDGGTNGMTMATQNMGLTSPSVPLTFDPLTVPCNSNINPTTTSALTASGNITFMNTGVGVSTTNVLLQNLTAGTSNNATTGASPATGAYSLTGIAPGDNVKITPSRTHPATSNDVDVVDAIILERYAAGPILFPAATHGMVHSSQAIAGDVDYDGDIDFVDVVKIRQAVVGFAAQQYIKTDWVFYPTTTAFSAMPFYTYTSPLMQCFGGVMTASNPNINFIGVKVGDVNQTAQSSITPTPGVEVRGTAAFSMEDTRMQVGEEIELPIYAKNFDDLFGYQTNIIFDTDYLEFVDLDLGTALPDMELEDFGLEGAVSGIIPAIWGGLNNADLKDGDLLFTLKFKATRAAKSLKGLIDFTNSERVASLAYNGELAAYALGLELTTAKANEFVLHPSVPNPFSENTKLSFELPESTTVVLTVTDLTGRVIYTTKSNMEEGYNEFWLNNSQLNASGVYYYQIKAGNYEVSDRVILMD